MRNDSSPSTRRARLLVWDVLLRYRDALAKDVFGRLSQHLPRLRQLLDVLNSRLTEIEVV